MPDMQDMQDMPRAKITDFITMQPSNMMGKCTTGSPITASIKIIKRLQSVIGDNVTCLLILGLIVIITLGVLWYIAKESIVIIFNWRQSVAMSMTMKPNIMLSYGDDVKYKERRDKHVGPTSGIPEATLFKKRMTTLTTRYSGYNKAMKRLAMNQKDPAATEDIIQLVYIFLCVE